MAILRPQIIVEERVLTNLISPEGNRVAAMLGTATWGPIGAVTTVSTFSNYISLFGDDKTGTGVTGVKGANMFFNNGGSLKFIRLDDGAADYAAYSAQKSGVDELDFTGLYKGTYGNNITITIAANAVTATSRDLTITDGKIIEIWNNNGAGYASNTAIISAISGNSALVDVELASTGSVLNVPDAISATALTGGLDGDMSIDIGDYTTAISSLLWSEDFNYLLIPGYTTDAGHATIVGLLDSRATTEKKYSRYITGVAKDETITTIQSRTSSGKRISLIAPNIKYTHRIDNTESIYDGSYLACAYCGKLCNLDLEVSGTHETIAVEGISVLESSGKEYYNKSEQEQLLQTRVNPIALIGNDIQCVRAITRNSSTSEVWIEEVIVDIVDAVKEACQDYLDTIIGKPNTENRRNIAAGRLDSILTSYVNTEILQEFQASTVVEGASADTAIATINIKPAYSLNFIEFTININ